MRRWGPEKHGECDHGAEVGHQHAHEVGWPRFWGGFGIASEQKGCDGSPASATPPEQQSARTATLGPWPCDVSARSHACQSAGAGVAEPYSGAQRSQATSAVRHKRRTVSGTPPWTGARLNEVARPARGSWRRGPRNAGNLGARSRETQAF